MGAISCSSGRFGDCSSPRCVSEQCCISSDMFLFIRYTCKCGFYLGFRLFLKVSHKSNCQICPKQQRGKINSDLPPWANDQIPAAGAQNAAAAEKWRLFWQQGWPLLAGLWVFWGVLFSSNSIQIDPNLHRCGFSIKKICNYHWLLRVTFTQPFQMCAQ